MVLTNGINHVAMLTSDLDRLVAFYVEVFDADVTADLTEGPVRHALVDLGGGAALHPFCFNGRVVERISTEMFDRGRLDHVALNVDDVETFEELRRRLVRCGASNGDATDFGVVRTVSFIDPDGGWGEIAQWKRGDPLPLDEAVVEPFES